jgi:hypothetical protein
MRGLLCGVLLPSGEKVAEARMRGEAALLALAERLNPSP